MAVAVWLPLQNLPAAKAPAGLESFLEKHCFDCHDASDSKGELNLADLPFDLNNHATFERWQRVFERVRDGEMPPAKKTRPEKTAAGKFLSSLKKTLLEADTADIAANGRVRSRRLTRTEYEHTIHDLLGIDIPLKDLLPEDPASHGFETVSAGQQLSHHQLARYLDVADLALDEAFDRAFKGDESYQRSCTPKELEQRRRGNYRGPDFKHDESISWPIGLQFFGKMYITEVPASGWYRITLRSVRSINDKHGQVWGTLRSGECSSSAPMLYMIGLVEATPQPRDLTFEAWIQKGHMLELKPNDGELRRAPTGAQGGNVSFEGRDLEKEGYAGIAHRGIDIERIYPLADRAKVQRNLFGEQDMKTAKRAALDPLLARFAQRAFRRPVSESQLAPYRDIGRQALADGASLSQALRAGYRAILCSPRFLTFIEAPGALDDHAIASRLSYALWVSMPDSQLTKLATSGKLKDSAVLTQQVERMLVDRKSERFIRSFTDQWLKLAQIDFTSPDQRQFKTFDPVLQESMVQETRTYFAEMIQRNLNATHLVDSDFAFLNERLARHYETSGPVQAGGGLQKIALADAKDKTRGGLLTQGAILKVTADGTATSPVVRGMFVNERILGEHIPPPPPGIPAIEPDIRGATSIRDQLTKHRSDSSCASCHLTIDPPGFALENFDPIGGWRKRYGEGKKGVPVDPSGETPEGAKFADLLAWKAIYTQRGDQLATAFARQFLTYATGAPIRFADERALGEIVNHTKSSNHGLRSILTTAVTSPIFLHK